MVSNTTHTRRINNIPVVRLVGLYVVYNKMLQEKISNFPKYKSHISLFCMLFQIVLSQFKFTASIYNLCLSSSSNCNVQRL